MAFQFFARTGLTGAGVADLDSLDGDGSVVVDDVYDALAVGDVAMTVIPDDATYYHTLKTGISAATSSPDLIRPLDNPDDKGWVLEKVFLVKADVDALGLAHTSLSSVGVDDHHDEDHGASHTDGVDDIQDATAGQKGLATADQITKLDAIEALADITDAINVAAAGATMDADTSLAGNGYFLDEDNMGSNDATKVPSQQSVKSYVDATRVVAQGGTGATSLTDHGIMLGAGTGAITVTAVLANGELLIGSAGLDPVPATLTAGTNISIDVSAGTITINAVGAGSATFVGLTDTPGSFAASGDFIVTVNSGATALVFNTAADTRTFLNVADGADVTGANAPQAHAAAHVNGDSIQNATNSQKGLATAAQITKLDGIETGADATPDATTTTKGKAELSTDAETVTGTDTVRTTTPANITAKMAAPGEIGGTTPDRATVTTAFGGATTVTSSSGIIILDVQAKDSYKIDALTENSTIEFTNIPDAGTSWGITFEVHQHASAAKTLAYPGAVDFGSTGAPDITTVDEVTKLSFSGDQSTTKIWGVPYITGGTS